MSSIFRIQIDLRRSSSGEHCPSFYRMANTCCRLYMLVVASVLVFYCLPVVSAEYRIIFVLMNFTVLCLILESL